jgi:inner membrane protein
MANGNTHRLAAALTIGSVLGYVDAENKESTARPLVGAGLAVVLTNLPDLLEPAVHPHHRQFFHSVAFCCLVGWGAYEVYKWEPDEEWKQAARFALLVGGGALLIHLALDALTKRSLPLIGKG